MKIYEYPALIQEQFEKAVDIETGEIIDEQALELMNQLEMDRDQKIEGVILWHKDLLAEAAAIKAEEVSLAERRKAKENKAEALNLTEQTVRVLMDQKVIDIGYVIRHKSRKRYIVVPELLQNEVNKRGKC